jgi:hypothetical protein
MEDKIFSKLGRYVFEQSLLQEKITELESTVKQLQAELNKKEE